MQQEIKFKETEIGKIPENWEVKTLESVANVEMGQSPKSKYYNEKRKGCPFLQGVTTFGSRYTRIERYTTKSPKVAQKGSILLSVRAPVGEINIAPEELCIGRGLSALTMKNNNNKFLYYLLLYLKKTIINHQTGTVYGSINKTIIENFKVPVPPLPEQKAIAKILSDLDDKIELNNDMNKTLEAIGQALFKHWFIDFEFPNKEGKPYKSSGGEMVYNEELDKKIPKGWEVENYSEYADTISGRSYKSEELEDSDTALVSLKCVDITGGFNEEGLKSYTGNYKEEQIVKDGDVVVAHTDLTQDREILGRPAIVETSSDYKTYVASLDLVISRPISDLISRGFIYFLLQSEWFRHHASGYANGTTVLHLSKKTLPEFRMPIPSEVLLKRFSKIAENIISKIHANNSEKKELEKIRDSLLPKLMSGKIRVDYAQGK